MTNTDLFNNLKNLMPGDTRTETVVIQNTSPDYDYVKIYLHAEPVSASASDFLQQLTLSVYNGDELLSSAPANEPGALSEHLNLGTFVYGDATTLSVTVSAPANLKNRYSDTSGEIVWVFTTEAYKDSQPVDADPGLAVNVVPKTSSQPISLVVSNSVSSSHASSTSAQAASDLSRSTAQSVLVLDLNTVPLNPWFIAFLVTLLLAISAACLALIKHKKPTL
ncbi:hypothetical protein IJI72_02855 [Candidatus Saccharibacteria bacterium]|nr:hypothetical protein [Candidatus Saccharibacteria bacterium]